MIRVVTPSRTACKTLVERSLNVLPKQKNALSLELYIAVIRMIQNGRYVYCQLMVWPDVIVFKSRSLIDMSLLLVKYLGLSRYFVLASSRPITQTCPLPSSDIEKFVAYHGQQSKRVSSSS